jgi:hypothetical protein
LRRKIMGYKVGFRKVTVTIATAGVAVPISSVPIKTDQIEIHIPSGNTDVVYIGNKDVDSSWIPRAKASTTTFTPSEKSSFTHGDYFDLSEIYLDAVTGGDTAIVQYHAVEKGV